MKRVFSLVIILLISHFVFAQKVNQFDSNGKRDGIWKKNFEGTDVLRYEGEFSHGKEVGLFKFYINYKGEAILSATKLFNKDNDIADVTFLASNGKVISEGQMNGKIYIGTWKYYQKDSNRLLTLETYNDKGELTGERFVYYFSGQIAEKKNYINGKLEGVSYTYTEQNTVLTESTYENNELHGVSKSYSPDEKIVAEGVFKRGKKDGIWKFYENGKLVEEKDFSYIPKHKKKTP